MWRSRAFWGRRRRDTWTWWWTARATSACRRASTTTGPSCTDDEREASFVLIHKNIDRAMLTSLIWNSSIFSIKDRSDVIYENWKLEWGDGTFHYICNCFACGAQKRLKTEGNWIIFANIQILFITLSTILSSPPLPSLSPFKSPDCSFSKR